MLNGVPKVLYFTDRKKIAEEIKLPENSLDSDYMIISPNQLGTGYHQLKHSAYSSWFGVYLNEEELRRLINGLNSIHSYVMKTQKSNEKYSDSNFFWKILFSISTLSILVATTIFIYVVLYDSAFSRRSEALRLCLFLAIGSLLFTVVLTLLSCKPIPKHQSYEFMLHDRMAKEIKRLNRWLNKRGLTLLGGKKCMWLELWKTKRIGTGLRPLISLLGRDPILVYEDEQIETILQERNDELNETYKKRYNIKYYKLAYMKEGIKKETERREVKNKLRDKMEEERKNKEEKLEPIEEQPQEQEASKVDVRGAEANEKENEPDWELKGEAGDKGK